jgi:5-methylcytosine-specific restriction endonuclease McrA
MENHPVLVLNQSYEPLNICRVRRAIPLLFSGKAEMLENGLGFIHTVRTSIAIPSVIRLDYVVRRPRKRRRMTRLEIFNRDSYTCQYCGQVSSQLTLDHVSPRHQGGQHTWENVVSACVRCNRRKAGRTPEQAGMKLKQLPGPPKNSYSFYIPHKYQATKADWQKYLPG